LEKIEMRIKNWLKNIKSWVKKNPVEFWMLVFILLIGAFSRLYKIDQYMTFLGDEGRDVIIVRRIFTELHPPLIGPGTSVGGVYLGPLYYYMMAPALLLANFSPVGPAVQIALLGVLTIAFVWFVGKKWFGVKAGLIAAGLYAISPTVITYSHSSWNPNIMPFFSLLSIYSIWKVWKEKKFNWLIILGVSFAFVIQSHYLGVLLVPTIALFWFLTLRNLKSEKGSKLEIRTFIRKSLLAALVFAVLMSPLLFFDLRHNWMNTKAMLKFYNERQTAVSVSLWSAIHKMPQMLELINSSLIAAKNGFVSVMVSFGILMGLLIAFIKDLKNKSAYLVLFTWLAFALIGLGFYVLPIYDHYLGFVFTLPFLLVGAFVSKLLEKGILSKIIAALFIVILIGVSIAASPLRYSPNRQMQRSQNVAAKILSLDGDRPFDLAVIAERNYEDGYRYFLELWGGVVLHADRWDPSSISDQLFVVCEEEASKCDPTHSPKAEVANFGMSKIDDQWEVDGVIIYKLSHTQ